MCLGLYWHGYSCWRKYSLRTLSVLRKIASDFGVGKKAVPPGLSHAEHIPEPSSSARYGRRCLGNTHQDAVGKSMMFLEYWNIFGRLSWISALWEPLKRPLVPSSRARRLSCDEYLNSEINKITLTRTMPSCSMFHWSGS